MQCKSFRENGAQLKSFDLVYFMASVDDPQTNAKFATSTDADYPILSDPSKDTARAYGVLSERGFASRWTFYIDASGTIVHIDKAVNPAAAGQDMVAKLTELGITRH